MTTIFQTKYDQLEAIAKCFGQQADINAAMMANVRKNTTHLKQDWEGKGAGAFFAEMDKEVFPALQRLTAALEEAKGVTLEIRTIIQMAEEEAAAPFKNGGCDPLGKIQNTISNNQTASKTFGSQQQGTNGDDPRLSKLWGDVKDTAIGKEFLALAGNKESGLEWGKTGKHRAILTYDETGATIIVLNKHKKGKLSDNEWKQIIAMELGNFANKEKFDNIHTNASNGDLSEYEYYKAMEKVEFHTRVKVVKAWQDGQFDDPPGSRCPCVFNSAWTKEEDFDKYLEKTMKDAPKRRKHFKKLWEEYYQDAYNKKRSKPSDTN